MGLPDRKDVPVHQTWDVGILYENDDAWQKDIEAEKKALADFSKYDQKLNDPETIISALDNLGEMEVRMDQLGHYGFLQQSTDMTDPHYNQLLRILDQLEADYNAELAKYRAQIMDNDNETLDAVSDKRPDLGAAIREFKRIKKHRLSSEVESALSSNRLFLRLKESIRHAGQPTCRSRILKSTAKHTLCHSCFMKTAISTIRITSCVMRHSKHSQKF